MSEIGFIFGIGLVLYTFYRLGFARGRKYERDQFTLDTYENWKRGENRHG